MPFRFTYRLYLPLLLCIGNGILEYSDDDADDDDGDPTTWYNDNKKKLYRMRATRMDVNCEYCLDELMESLHRIPIKFANGV